MSVINEVRSVKVSTQDVSNVVAKSGGIPQPKVTKKQMEKQQKKMKEYWNGMITRKEAYELLNEALRNEQEKSRLMFIQIKTITEFLVSKGMTTKEELDQLSIPIVDEIYGKPTTQQQEKEEEGENVVEQVLHEEIVKPEVSE